MDSLTAVGSLRARGVDALVDLGSGGGFPGLPLAVALPATRTLLVESVGKKSAFLETVVAATGRAASVEVAATRAETVGREPGDREQWPAVTARAVGSLADLAELAFPLLRVGGYLVAWKRTPLGAELDAARRAVDALGGGTIDLVEPSVASLPGNLLVIVRKGGATTARYPRDPAERRRRPW